MTSLFQLSWGQKYLDVQIDQTSNRYLFTYLKESYLIKNDSIYCLSNPVDFPSKLHGLDISKFNFISNDSIGYMKNESNGIVYSFDGVNFKRLDQSFIFNSQFKSYSFIHKNIPMDFGGYGLFSFKNFITYFNTKKKETELLIQKSPISKSPSPRFRSIGQYQKGGLFIGPGIGINLNSNYPSKKDYISNDYWKFTFDDLTWVKLGEGDELLDKIMNNYMYDFIYDFNNTALFVSLNKLFQIDIKNNILTDFPNANFDIIKSLNIYHEKYLMTYNKKQDGFYFIINKSNDQLEVLFIERNSFLGDQKIITNLYNTSPNYIAYYGVLFLFLTIFFGFLIFKRNNRSTTQKLKPKLNSIRDEIKLEDFRILNILINDYPEYTNYSDLMDVFPEHYSYENKKKKIKLSLSLLEDYLHENFKLNKPVFEFRKNLEDRREKQLRIK